MAKHGKLIVIDGTDSVGKATQTKLLVARLKREGKKVATLDFPQYKQNFFGKFVGEMLTGKYGDFLHVDPYIASVMYAADRFESKGKIEQWLKEGRVVILDRYVSANQMHQGGKIKDAKKRRKFLKWLDTMEHKVFGLPRPDLIIYLSLPVGLSQKLMVGRGKKDQHEKSTRHLQAARDSALKLIASSSKWRKIECADKSGNILPRQIIHKLVYKIVRR